MKSPFPGMDPYIEACGLWASFHGHLIEEIYRSIARVLPRGYIADTGVRSYVVLVEAEEGKDESPAIPDVTITQPVGKKPRKSKGGVAVAEPAADAESVPMQAFIAEEFEERFIEIYAQGEERVLVTCVEVLSPSNKRPGSEGWDQYERKRQAMLLGRANFIEIDLLRGGSKMPMLTPWPASPYTLLVSRRTRPTHARVWKAYLDRPLPPIPVPLVSSDPDLTLDLQPLIDDISSLARYDEQINYSRRLTPALAGTEAVVVRGLLKGRAAAGGRRRS
jgi:hypothetical protein